MGSRTKKARKSPASVHGRSVVDYVDDSELLAALKTVTPQGIARNDWILPVADPDAHEQTVDGELARLRTLQSYLLLDADPDPAFDKLTEEACRIFGVPTSLISLVDLGRQYLFSNTGAAARETPRDVAFCSHTIMNKSEDGVLVVEDTIQDDRFRNNPLVTSEPKLRFYAGASLISPEGHRLGTFCVEGQQPRVFTDQDRETLKKYAATAVAMMVERRRELRDCLSVGHATLGDTQNHWLRHAAVTTNLGDAMFSNGDSITAMQLFQESVQSIMQITTKKSVTENEAADHSSSNPPEPSNAEVERHNRMVHLLSELKSGSKYCKLYESLSSSKTRTSEVMEQVKALFEGTGSSQERNLKTDGSDIADVLSAASAIGYTGIHPHDGIPGLFNTLTKIKGACAPRPLPPLVFEEMFSIDMTGIYENLLLQPEKASPAFPIDERPFTVSMGECSKATLFNMGLIHYHWCRPDTALQFFHLAASLSHKFSPLKFDPVDLCSVNNMAQIHLLLRKPDEAMAMLNETLNRGNATLSALYKTIEEKRDNRATKAQVGCGPFRGPSEVDEDDAEALALQMAEEVNDEAARKTRRLRRKLARTLLDMAHVHFFNNELDKALARCREAITLVDDHMSGVTLAAAWYNLSMVLHHQGQNNEALSCLDNFIRLTTSNQLIPKDHVQYGDAYQLKGAMLYDLGRYQECVQALEETSRIRQVHFGPSSGTLVETLGLLGKAYLAMQQVDKAIEALTKCREIESTISKASTVPEDNTYNSNGKRDSPSSSSPDSNALSRLSLEAAQVILDLGRAYQIKGDVKAAWQEYVLVRDWAQAFFGADHAFPARISSLLEKLSNVKNSSDDNKTNKCQLQRLVVQQ